MTNHHNSRSTKELTFETWLKTHADETSAALKSQQRPRWPKLGYDVSEEIGDSTDWSINPDGLDLSGNPAMPGDRGHAQLKAAQANRRPSIETLASDAFERVAQLLGVAVDLDAPEQALFASVERAVAALVRNSQNAGAFNDLSSDCAAVASSRAVRAGHVDEVTAEDRDFVRKTLRGES